MSLVIDLPRPAEGRPKAETTARLDSEEQRRLNAPSIALLQSWLKRSDSPSSPEKIAEAEADLAQFMRDMNAPRREAGERLHFPDVNIE